MTLTPQEISIRKAALRSSSTHEEAAETCSRLGHKINREALRKWALRMGLAPNGWR